MLHHSCRSLEALHGDDAEALHRALDAMRARETFVTSGPRIKPRFFGGAALAQTLAARGVRVLLIADTLRLLGQGTKVAVEVAIMAADAGALSGADIISIGGSGSGADAALVLKPAHQNNFFDCRIREIICKPRLF